jgi:4-hydroxy-tetrahydrodipicolinate synthase
MFIDTNPIPVKAALALMGRIEEVYRLPLCELDNALKERLRRALVDSGLLEK